MTVGSCALCLQHRPLHRSHFLPAGFYRRMPTPETVTTHAIRATSKQTWDYVLCSECERRFAERGEDYVLKLVADCRTGTCPLLDLLNRSTPFFSGRIFRGYSGKELGVDTAKLVYFALSYIWRAAVRVWPSPVRPYRSTRLELGPWAERFRFFLLGEKPLPREIAVWLVVGDDRETQSGCSIPSPAGKHPPYAYGFWALGLSYRIVLGCGIPDVVMRSSCLQPERPLWVADRGADVVKALSELRSLRETNRIDRASRGGR